MQFLDLPTELLLGILMKLPLRDIWELRALSTAMRTLVTDAFILKIRRHQSPFMLQLILTSPLPSFATARFRLKEVTASGLLHFEYAGLESDEHANSDLFYGGHESTCDPAVISFPKPRNLSRDAWALKGLLDWKVDNAIAFNSFYTNSQKCTLIPFEPLLSPCPTGTSTLEHFHGERLSIDSRIRYEAWEDVERESVELKFTEFVCSLGAVFSFLCPSPPRKKLPIFNESKLRELKGRVEAMGLAWKDQFFALPDVLEGLSDAGNDFDLIMRSIHMSIKYKR